MGWLSAVLGKYESKREPIATADELHGVFETERDHLYWIALVITGDTILAEKCLVDASELSAYGAGVFRDWISTWSRSATARIASNEVRETVTTSAEQYANRTCDHANHPLLSQQEMQSIRLLDPADVISELDAISRAVLVLRGFQSSSLADCALQLQVPRKCVMAAYCNALQWVHKKAQVADGYVDLAHSHWLSLGGGE